MSTNTAPPDAVQQRYTAVLLTAARRPLTAEETAAARFYGSWLDFAYTEIEQHLNAAARRREGNQNE